MIGLILEGHQSLIQLLVWWTCFEGTCADTLLRDVPYVKSRFDILSNSKTYCILKLIMSFWNFAYCILTMRTFVSAWEIYQSCSRTYSRSILRYDLDTTDRLSHSERFILIFGGLRSMAYGFYIQRFATLGTNLPITTFCSVQNRFADGLLTGYFPMFFITPP